MSLDTEAIRARLESIDRDLWRDACEPIAGDASFRANGVFVQNAPDDIAALLSEVDRLTAENEGLHADNEALRAELADTMTVLEDAKNDCDKMLRRLGVDNTDD